jgi:cell division septation protein DedD
MDKYLLEILKEINTIIIPGLGALTITDKTTGEIKFMPYLTHDDGALSRYISESEGMEENDSKNLIAKYVREIHAELDKGESYDMYKFGSFFKNGDEIEFKNWGDGQNQKSDPYENKASTEDNSQKEKSPKIPLVKKPESKKKSEEQSSEKPDKKSDKIEQEKNTKEPTANNDTNIGDNENKTESKAPIKKKQNLNIQQKEELSPNEKKLDDLKQQNNTNSKKTKRGVGFWMLLSLIILIVAGGTYIMINYDDIKQHIPFLADNPQSTDHERPEKMKEIIGENNQSESSTDQIVASESIKVNDTNKEGNEDAGEGLVEEQADEKNTKEEVTSDIPPSNENSFHVIAGAFSSESNAKLLGNKLRAKGYDVKVGRGRGMNLVSIKSFATRTEANQTLADFKEVAPNCWVYEWK